MKRFLALLLMLAALWPAALAESYLFAAGNTYADFYEYSDDLQYYIFTDEGALYPLPKEYVPVHEMGDNFLAYVDIDGWPCEILLDATGNPLCEPIDGYIRNRTDDRFGFFLYDDLSRTSGRVGIMDTEGNILIPAIYDEICVIEEGGYFALLPNDDQLLLLDERGNVTETGIHILDFSLPPSVESMLGVTDPITHGVGFVDSSGQWAIPPKMTWLSTEQFQNGIAEIRSVNAMLIDTEGNSILPEEKPFFPLFQIGKSILAPLGGFKYEIYSLQGEYLFQSDGSIYEFGNVYISSSPDWNTSFVRDRNGNVICESQEGNYDGIAITENATYLIYRDNSSNMECLLSEDGTQLSDFYASLSEGVLLPDGRMTFVACTGEMILEENWNGYVIREGTSRYGLIDAEGNILIDFVYEYLWRHNYGNYLIFETADSEGILRPDGSILFDIEK